MRLSENILCYIQLFLTTNHTWNLHIQEVKYSISINNRSVARCLPIAALLVHMYIQLLTVVDIGDIAKDQTVHHQQIVALAQNQSANKQQIWLLMEKIRQIIQNMFTLCMVAITPSHPSSFEKIGISQSKCIMPTSQLLRNHTNVMSCIPYACIYNHYCVY